MKTRVLFCLLGVLLVGAGCGNKEEVERLQQEVRALRQENKSKDRKLEEQKNDPSLKAPRDRLIFLAQQMQGIKANLKTSEGEIEVRFFPEKAPLHVFAFVSRAEAGFYDGTQFHRVIKGFMLQGGDPLSKDSDPSNDGTGGPLVMIPHEFNDGNHTPGVLSMARVGDVRVGAGSQFFIMHGAAPQLNGQYTVFGEVTQGMDVVNRIAEMKTGPGDRPVKTVTLEKVTVFRE